MVLIVNLCYKCGKLDVMMDDANGNTPLDILEKKMKEKLIAELNKIKHQSDQI